ncbi:50S ribosomal protein L3 N(5)-glutamine methyltransferase [Orrella marina]|uniref:50S ribosomal protein L3 N(5)-glutamine methyltransferase n=1 Tax=Orrella marina TaxID=2163011 RepID=A0A2R4XPH4_9BURK|nr:50S ribosomal protein L3 N(5)-glutamine methyltransferase [Orrella marina]AWB35675.1 50S ribosomal protein L3 N(5)-glutamine methyltransferase [Orrella marina]
MQQEAIEHLGTVRDWIRFGVSRLEKSGVVYGQGTDNAWDESVFLVLRTLDLPVDELEPFLDARVLPQERHRLYHVLDRRCRDQIPAAYILGEAWLSGLRFIVNEDVLIPRSPVSELIQEGFSPWLDDRPEPGRIVDACTGSGCLAILAALRFPHAEVLATDISERALAVAAQNIALYGLTDRITLVQTDMIEALAPDNTCDLILCNPPYVNSTSMTALPAEFQHEPELALTGGQDGMQLVARLIEQIQSRISPTGHLILEIGHEKAHFESAFPDLNPTWLQTEAADDQIMLLAGNDLIK